SVLSLISATDYNGSPSRGSPSKDGKDFKDGKDRGSPCLGGVVRGLDVPDVLAVLVSRRLSARWRLGLPGDRQEELLDDLFQLHRVAGQVAELLLQDFRPGPHQRAARAGLHFVGVQLVEELQLLVGILQSLRIHLSSLSCGTAAP